MYAGARRAPFHAEPLQSRQSAWERRRFDVSRAILSWSVRKVLFWSVRKVLSWSFRKVLLWSFRKVLFRILFYEGVPSEFFTRPFRVFSNGRSLPGFPKATLSGLVSTETHQHGPTGASACQTKLLPIGAADENIGPLPPSSRAPKTSAKPSCCLSELPTKRRSEAAQSMDCP